MVRPCDSIQEIALEQLKTGSISPRISMTLAHLQTSSITSESNGFSPLMAYCCLFLFNRSHFLSRGVQS